MATGTSSRESFDRSHPRATGTDHLSARLLSPGCDFAARRVLELSAAGILITGDDLDVAAVTRFEILGPRLRSAGIAEVAHRSEGTIGLKFLKLDAVTEEDLHDVVVGRPTPSREAAVARQAASGSL
jgi:hypothetical protein